MISRNLARSDGELISALFKINNMGTRLNNARHIVSSNGSNREWAELIIYLGESNEMATKGVPYNVNGIGAFALIANLVTIEKLVGALNKIVEMAMFQTL